MKSSYFCQHHAELMKVDESEACKYWTEMMHRGVRAYAGCRMEAASIYLGSALDIALLRRACTNKVFEADHISKPTEFIIQLMIIDNRFQEATSLLARLCGEGLKSELKKFLDTHLEKVQLAKNTYLKSDVQIH